MVTDEFDQGFVRADRVRLRQRDCCRAGFDAGPLTFAGCVRISGRHYRAVGHGVIGATRRC